MDSEEPCGLPDLCYLMDGPFFQGLISLRKIALGQPPVSTLDMPATLQHEFHTLMLAFLTFFVWTDENMLSWSRTGELWPMLIFNRKGGVPTRHSRQRHL